MVRQRIKEDVLEAVRERFEHEYEVEIVDFDNDEIVLVAKGHRGELRYFTIKVRELI